MKKKTDTRKLVMTAILTAIVVVLQFLALGTRALGIPFSIAPVLIPIVIGAATCGIGAGAWLGLVFGAVVLISGDASAFLVINWWGTIITVLVKGVMCGLAAGAVYKAFEKFNKYLAVIAAALICPLVNTGIFLLGCVMFFMDTIVTWAGSQDVVTYMFVGLCGINFIIELVINMFLSPIVFRLLKLREKA